MTQGPMAMAEPSFIPLTDDQNDDLPRTFRREKEARAREARERAAQERAAAPSLSATPDAYAPAGPALHAAPHTSGHASGLGPQPRVEANADYAPAISEMPYPAAVRRFDVPFLHLVAFFLKAVLAAIPALILLFTILWFAGAALHAFFPELVKMKILISFPN